MPSVKFLQRSIPVALFTLFLITGLFIYKDYGTYFDEKYQIDIGIVNYRYINQGDPFIFSFRDEYYGPLYELLLLIFSHNLADPDMIQTRHLAIFLTFSAGLVVFFFLAKRITRSTWWALLASVILAVSPRIFADAFYNSKDIPFLVFFIFSFFSLIKVSDDFYTGKSFRQVLSAVLLCAILAASATAIRMVGVIITLLFILMVLLHAIIKPKQSLHLVSLTLIFLLTFGCFLVLFMPVLWHDPAGEFINALKLSSRYDLWKYDILFEGRMFPANDTVWNYLPVWIGVTTPYLPLFSLIAGFLFMVRDGWKMLISLINAGSQDWRNRITTDGIGWLGVVAWFVGPVTAVYVLHSVLYDAWRHMFFIYPALVLIGVYSLRAIFYCFPVQTKKHHLFKVVFSLVLLIGLLEPLLFCVRNHPFENVYFNRFAGDTATIRQRFDVDYWGLSTKQGIDYILKHDPSSRIRIFAEVPAMLYTEFLLMPEDKIRIVFTDESQADYLVTNYRWHPEDYPYLKYFAVHVSGMEIMTVYCVRAVCP